MTLLQWSVRTRLGVGFGLVILLLACVAGMSLLQMAGFNRKVEALATVRLGQLVTVSQASNVLGQDIRSTGNILVLDDEKQVKEELTNVHNNQGAMRELLAKLEKTTVAGREKDLFDGIVSAVEAYGPHEKKFLELVEHGDYSSAKDEMLKAVRPAQNRLIDAMDQFESYQSALSADEARQAGEAYELTRTVVIALASVALVLAVLLSWAITRSIIKPIEVAVTLAQRVAAGDLTVQVHAKGRDETAQLLRSLGEMADRLRSLVGEVAGGAHVVADTSAQIAQGNVDLSQRTEEQAGTLEETASSMEELTSTVTQNAENARNATRFAVSAAEVAKRGGQVVGDVVRTMTGISDSSRKISEIIAVIDGIAFQTNILALNAAVEAARAGDQGRGFAVVATEVRNLAQRSAAAAKEIKTLITDSVGKVDAGTRLVADAGTTMTEIVSSVSKVSELIAEIAAASQEQSSGIEQVNKAIAQMDQVVQQNASLVEEASAATESMKGQAASLLHTVSRFRLREDEAAAAVPRGTPAPAESMALQSFPSPIKVRREPARATALAKAEAAPAGQWQQF
jgi:methyl-accepting chemotaxis protein